jgi:hypothetical protein
MKVRAKVTLQYGIIRKEGVEFSLSDPKHFDERVMEALEAIPNAKAKGKAAATAKTAPAKVELVTEKPVEEPDQTTPEEDEVDEANGDTGTEIVIEKDDETEGGDDAKEDAPAAQEGSSAPVRRRSTAAQRSKR